MLETMSMGIEVFKSFPSPGNLTFRSMLYCSNVSPFQEDLGRDAYTD